MKKQAVFFSFFFFMMTTVFGACGMFVLRCAYVNEIHTVQNLAGRVIAKYPETENAFLEALGDMERKDREAGVRILALYGYDEQEKIKENESYRQQADFLRLYLSVFLAAAFLWIFAFCHAFNRKKKRQEEQLLLILDDCLSGRYGFLEKEEPLSGIDNPLFADTLMKLGKSLKLKARQLDEEHDSTKTLVTDISHQLRTPISALKACFALYSEAEEQSEKEEFSARCGIQIDKLEMLTEALTNISRLETHLIRLQFQPVQLTELLLNAVNTVYHKAMQKQISIETDEFEEVTLNLDQKWTVEAIANVLDNAVKYSPAGSIIRIRAVRMVNFVRIEFEDNGIGIPIEEQNRIFRRFYRGSSDIVKNAEGIGVGLYLSRKILEDEGGTIYVHPAKEKGSVFVIQLPL